MDFGQETKKQSGFHVSYSMFLRMVLASVFPLLFLAIQSSPQTVIANGSSSSSAPTVIANGSSSSSAPTAIITGSSTSVSMANRTSNVPSIWHNNNSINMTLDDPDNRKVRVVLSRQDPVGFVCGFYCIGSCSSYLFSVLAVGNGGDILDLVWSANRDYPVRENASLQLTEIGDLILEDSDGTRVWSTDTSGKSVLGMNMTEAGNLILFDGEGATVWQSFDHPTDTLLVGQRLYEGQKLIATSSDTNWSHGLYYATLTSSIGFAAFVEVGQNQSLMYYQLAPDQSSRNDSSRSNFAVLEQYRFVVNLGASKAISGSNPLEFPAVIEYIKLDSDGHLKIHQLTSEKGLIVIADLVTEDFGACQHPLICGEYGVCRQGQCSCPQGQDGEQYFNQTQFQLPNQGCSRITSLSCQPSRAHHRLTQLRNVTFFNVIDSEAAVPMIKELEKCKLACLQNCSCAGAFFRYETNLSDGYCYMPSKILSIREGNIPKFNFTTAAFIKVQIPNAAPNPVPVEGITPENSPSPPAPRKQINLAAIVGGSVGGGALFICIVFVIVVVTVQKNSNEMEGEDSIKQVLGTPVRFSHEDLCAATGEFKEKLGSGGFGSVFKGVLADGTSIAVKRLDKMSQDMREFLAEVETIGSIHHFNLVRLIGYCAEKTSRLLVYEYMSNGSLDNWIYSSSQRPCLDWKTRKNIILDIAKGLAYLHEECRQRIVHLDIKPQNILLDEKFNAKVSDFGLSKLFDRDKSQVLITMRGTPGYLAPEWKQSKVTVKVDIYSFGIVLLEIVSGRRNLDHSRSESSLQLLRVLQRKAEEDQLIDIVENLDEDMQNNREEIIRMIKLGAWCLQDDHTRRPHMSIVVKVLEGVMEVDPNIDYKFSHAMNSCPTAINVCVSSVPQASLLSAPR